MNVKRFKEEMGIAKFIDNQTGKEYSEYNLDEIVGLLNELADENEQLKTVINRYEKYSNKKNDELNFRQLDILKLKEENEQLRKDVARYRGNFREMEDVKCELAEENEQLKEQLFETSKELLWATSDEVDRALYYEDEVEELRKEIFE